MTGIFFLLDNLLKLKMTEKRIVSNLSTPVLWTILMAYNLNPWIFISGGMLLQLINSYFISKFYPTSDTTYFTKKKKDINHVFKDIPTHISLTYHDMLFQDDPERAINQVEAETGIKLTPTLFCPIIIQWQEQGRGFGEYTFWQKDGKIYCDNEHDSKETVKRILCRMVDDSIFNH